MFSKQTREDIKMRDAVMRKQLDKLHELYIEEVNPKKRRGKKGYIDSGFFHWIGLKYRDEKIYTTEFWTMVDLLIRKNLTSYKFLGYSDLLKSDMYSEAIFKIDKYLFSSFDESKANLFTYATSTIISAFWDILRNRNRHQSILKSNDAKERYEMDIMDDDGMIVDADKNERLFSGTNTLRTDVVLDHILDIKRNDWFDMLLKTYKAIANNYFVKTEFKIVEDNSLPKFQRKSLVYHMLIEKKILLEIYHPALHNHTLFGSKTYIAHRAKLARQNGYQYLQYTLLPRELEELLQPVMDDCELIEESDIVNDSLLQLRIADVMKDIEDKKEYVNPADINQSSHCIRPDKCYIPDKIYKNLVELDENIYRLFNGKEWVYFDSPSQLEELEAIEGNTKVYTPRRLTPKKDAK